MSMPEHDDLEKLRGMAASDEEAKRAARSLEDAADSHGTLEGFEAMNNEHFSPELTQEAQDDQPEDQEKGHSPV